MERFNRTLKGMMWKYFYSKGTYAWIDVLDELVENYNTTRHGRTLMKRADVNSSNKDAVWVTLYGSALGELPLPKFGYQFMFRARMYRSLIPVSNSVKDQRTAHSCAKHKLITDKWKGKIRRPREPRSPRRKSPSRPRWDTSFRRKVSRGQRRPRSFSWPFPGCYQSNSPRIFQSPYFYPSGFAVLPNRGG